MPTRASATLLVTSVALVAATASGAGAQISPGPLARAHASLEGPRNCTQCHGSRKEPTTQRCLACHREIAWLQQRGEGFHARGDARGACSSCHPDHAGRAFALIQWPGGSPERFDHARGTGYTLDGSHATAKCTACHTPRLRASTAASLSPRRAGAGWVGLATTCTSCHADPHRGSLEGACTRCHDTGRWKDAPTFDHAESRYPLTGEHRDVKCAGCHLVPRLAPPRDSLGRPVPVFKPVPSKDCASCHADPHGGRLAGRCSSCHVTSGFKTVQRGAFDHERTRYPLRGRHALVSCASCHGVAAGGKPATMRPTYATCAGCHTDAHGGQLVSRADRGACESCHTVRGWRPSTFTVAQHASLRLTLDGAHATTACASCHASTRDGLAPPPANIVAGAARFIMRPAELSCAQCHADPHAWRRAGPAPECTACHTTRTFRPTTMSATAHDSTDFRLDGAHLAVPCVSCHTAMGRAAKGSTLVRARPSLTGLDLRTAGTACATCHADPHGGRITRAGNGACDRCHTTTAFTPVARFDHGRDAGFVLEGAHARVPCVSCHRQSADAKPGSPLTYTALPTACERCHATANANTGKRP